MRTLRTVYTGLILINLSRYIYVGIGGHAEVIMLSSPAGAYQYLLSIEQRVCFFKDPLWSKATIDIAEYF